MKSNKIWYLGYSISLFSLILLLTLDLNEALRVCLIMVFAISLAVSHVQIMHRRLLETDHDYKISMNDERNEKIRKTRQSFGRIHGFKNAGKPADGAFAPFYPRKLCHPSNKCYPNT